MTNRFAVPGSGMAGRSVRGGVAVLAAAALVAGCGSSSSGSGSSGSSGSSNKVSAEQYANSVCSAMSSVAKVESSASSMGNANTPAKLKAEMVKLTSALSSGMIKANAAITASVPDVSGGADFVKKAEAAFGPVAKSSTQWVSEAKALPTSNIQAMEAPLQKLVKQMSGIGTQLNKVNIKTSPALEKAGDKAPACKALNAS